MTKTFTQRRSEGLVAKRRASPKESPLLPMESLAGGQEKWLPIVFAGGAYAVSDKGHVRSLRTRRTRTKGGPLKERIVATGYEQVAIYVHGHRTVHYVARLVAIAFLPNPKLLPEVNHKDGNKRNNAVENLEWISHQENCVHALKSGLWRTHEKRKGVEKPKCIKSACGAQAMARGLCERHYHRMKNLVKKKAANWSDAPKVLAGLKDNHSNASRRNTKRIEIELESDMPAIREFVRKKKEEALRNHYKQIDRDLGFE